MVRLALERPAAKNPSVCFDIFRANPDMTDLSVLVLPGAFASSVSATLDVLSAAAALAPSTGATAPSWRVWTVDGVDVPLAHGLVLKGRPFPKRPLLGEGTWVVPGLGLDSGQAVAARLANADARRVVSALRSHVSAGGSVAASCSAVFLLQAAGLLEGRQATTSWWLAPALRRASPGCAVDARRMVVADGPVTTAGAALAQADLMLHLLRTRFGMALADAVSRVLLLDARDRQGAFIVPSLLASGDTFVAGLVDRIEQALPTPPSVADLARAMCVSERTLARRVKAATGQGPLALVQSVRLRQARRLLETSRLGVDRIAEAVGYGDATALRRLMKKTMGASPRQLRGA